MGITALDARVNFKMFLQGIGQRIQGILAKSLSPEQKLSLILEEMCNDTQQKRLTARSIRTRMVSLSDPETKELEPLEQLKAKREKFVKLGSQVLKEKEVFEANGKAEEAKLKEAQLGQISQEIKTLDMPLRSMESTYETLKESYEVALQNYKTALAAYEHTKENGPTILLAIKAHQEALQTRDATRKPQKQIDASFLNDLAGELESAKGALRSDKEIDREMDATNPSVNKLMVEQDRNSIDENILAEFRKG